MEALLISILKVVFIDIILGGDNAVVIAMACRKLPKDKKSKAVLLGTIGAVLIRIIFTIAAVWLMMIPGAQIIGGILLLAIAIKLIKGEDEGKDLAGHDNMMAAVKTIIFADLVMSLDNVLAVAGAAHGNIWLILFGLALSIPIIVWGSQLLMKLMNRFPIIVVLGGALLGYTSGEMVLGDKFASHFIETHFPLGHYIIPVGLAVLVVLIGKLANRKQSLNQAA